MEKKDYALLLSDAFTGLSFAFNKNGDQDNYFAMDDIYEKFDELMKNEDVKEVFNDLIHNMVNGLYEGEYKHLIDTKCMVNEWLNK